MIDLWKYRNVVFDHSKSSSKSKLASSASEILLLSFDWVGLTVFDDAILNGFVDGTFRWEPFKPAELPSPDIFIDENPAMTENLAY